MSFQARQNGQRLSEKIFRERIGGHGEKERAIGPFFSPIAVL